jgi:hypothetical protein
MLEQCRDRHGIARCEGDVNGQPGKTALQARGQRRTTRIIGLDAVAGQFGDDPAGKVPIRGHQRRGRLRNARTRFERAAHGGSQG